ncbi:hypothetical protein EDC01DRAFT_641300 [Geopyxis carbonaria]|nr:hypothetical protein EDC01DRAFT_641300 [Geopyxis carbonaria]
MASLRPLTSLAARRAFSTSRPGLVTAAGDTIAAVPVKKPVGGFRGGIFGFLLGSTVAGAAGYFYVYEEHKVSSELLTEDIDTLRSSIMRIEKHVRTLEESLADQAAAMSKKK